MFIQYLICNMNKSKFRKNIIPANILNIKDFLFYFNKIFGIMSYIGITITYFRIRQLHHGDTTD